MEFLVIDYLYPVVNNSLSNFMDVANQTPAVKAYAGSRENFLLVGPQDVKVIDYCAFLPSSFST